MNKEQILESVIKEHLARGIDGNIDKCEIAIEIGLDWLHIQAWDGKKLVMVWNAPILDFQLEDVIDNVSKRINAFKAV